MVGTASACVLGLVVAPPAGAVDAPAAVKTAKAAKGPAVPPSAPGAPVPDAPRAAGTGVADLVARARESGQPVDVPSLRTEESSTQVLPDGRFETSVSQTPVNLSDGQGGWEPIDTTLVAAAGGGWTAGNVGYELTLPASLDGAAAKVAGDGARVELLLDGAAGTAGQVSGSTVTYRDVLPGVDVEMTAAPEGLRTFAVLKSAEAQAALPWQLRTDGEQRAVPGEAGQVALPAASDGASEGREGLVVPPAFAVDAAGAVVMASDDAPGPLAVDVAAPGELPELPALPAPPAPPSPAAPEAHGAPGAPGATDDGSEVDGQGVDLRLQVEEGWLESPQRQFPVRVDPSVVLAGAPAFDCHIVQNLPTTSYCSSDTLEVGREGAAGVRRALLDFDVRGAIPADVVVQSADLTLSTTSFAATTSPGRIDAHVVRRGWSPNTTTWQRRYTTDAWATPGGRIGSGSDADVDSAVAAFTTAQPVAGAGVGFYGLGGAVQRWVDGSAPDHGLMLTKTGEDSAGLFRYASADHADANRRPRLVVRWSPPAGQLSTDTYVTERLNDRTTVGVNPASGNLLVRQQDVTVAGNGPDFSVERVYNSLDAYYGQERFPGIDTFSGKLGLGWTADTLGDVQLNYDYNARRADLYGPGGITVAFRFDEAAGRFVTPPGFDAELDEVPGSPGLVDIRLTDGSGVVYRFTQGTGPYLLLWVRDRNGNTINLGDDTRPVDTRGRAFPVTTSTAGYGGERATAVTDPAGRVQSYAYGDTAGSVERGLLLSHTSPVAGAAPTRYAYTSDKQLWKVTDPDGREFRVWYDSQGRVAKLWRMLDTSGGSSSATGYATTYDYVDETTTRVTDARGNTTTYRLDDQGRITSTVDPAGNTRSSSYTTNGKINTLTNGTNGQTAFSYDDQGRLISSKQASTAETTYGGYGPTGSPTEFQPTSVSDPNGTTALGYDAAGNQTSATAPGGATSRTVYNADGSLRATTRPNGVGTAPAARGECARGSSGSTADNCTSYTYTGSTTFPTALTVTPPTGARWQGTTRYTFDGLSRTTSVRDGRGVTATYSYDAQDRVTQISYSDATPAVGYTYDASGNVRQVQQGSVTTTLRYDPLNRTKERKTTGRPSLGYGYDEVDNLTGAAVDGVGTTYSYNPTNTLAQVRDPDNATFKFDYDADGRRTDTRFPGGATQTFGYDGGGRTTSVKATRPTGAAVHDLRYCYSAGGASTASCTGTDLDRVEHQRDTVTGKTTDFTYTHRRLTGAATTGGPTYGYGYDPSGNLTTASVTGQTTRRFAYDPAEALCAVRSGTTTPTCTSAPDAATTTYGYDAAGNQNRRNGQTIATYDGANRTTGYDNVAYTYAGNGQDDRLTAGSRAFTEGLLGTQQYTDSTTAVRITATPDGQLLALRRGTAKHHYLLDRQSSVIGLLDAATGQTSATYTYDPYGVQTAATGTAATLNPYRYIGGHADPNGLLKTGVRYYQPTLARFTQTDPTRQDPTYLYATGDPLNRADPSGADSAACFISATAIVGGTAGIVGGVAATAGTAGLAAVPGVATAVAGGAALAGGIVGVASYCF